MGHEDSLLGEYKGIRVVEDLPIDSYFECYKTEIEQVWKEFKERNPRARDDPKLRLNSYEINGDIMVLHLGRGVSFANVIYTDVMRQRENLPASPEETYVFENGRYVARFPFSNVTSVAGIILFDPNRSYDVSDPDLRSIFSVRSKRVATNPGSLGLLVNGYVDIEDDSVINEDLLIDNLFRETEEESYLTRKDVENIEFVGPSQTRGKTCDLTWLVRTGLSYEGWKKVWLEKGRQHESRGVVPVSISQVKDVLDLEKRREMLLREGILSDELRRDLGRGDIPTHPFYESIHPILANKLPKYFERMIK